jgi:hypothetical protein
LLTELHHAHVLHPIPSFTALRNVVKSYADRMGDKALKAALAKFPKKELYGSTRDAVVANRINGLNAFLHDLHAFSAIHTEVLYLYMAWRTPGGRLWSRNDLG